MHSPENKATFNLLPFPDRRQRERRKAERREAERRQLKLFSCNDCEAIIELHNIKAEAIRLSNTSFCSGCGIQTKLIELIKLL